MDFYQKLDYLMTLTKTTNSVLAFNVSLDPSYISRLRNGKRKPSKNGDYIQEMALYFAKNTQGNMHLNTLKQQLALEEIVIDQDQLAKAIYRWLMEEKDREKKVLEGFIDQFSGFTFKIEKPTDLQESEGEADFTDKTFYYGNQGKREGALRLLTAMIHNKKKDYLLLFSDESMEWMKEDRHFITQWESLMKQVLLKGHRIKIIHTVNRNLDDMLAAIQQWLPLYMTGLIEPYYYPKKRDGLFKRTLFVASECAAFTSVSIDHQEKEAPNLFITDKDGIQGFIKEFDVFLNQCRPLVRVYRKEQRKKFQELLKEFDEEKGNTIIKSETLSGLSMPNHLIESIFSHIDSLSRQEELAYWTHRRDLFLKNLKTYERHEIIRLPQRNELTNGKIYYPIQNLFLDKLIPYTIKTFSEHLENVINLMEKYENYYVSIQDLKDQQSIIYYKENVGALIGKARESSVFLALNEPNMTAALGGYLEDYTEVSKQKRYERRQETIKKLRNYLRELKQTH